MLVKLNRLPSEDRAKASSEILALLTCSATWRGARFALLFHPLRSEPDLSPLFRGETPMLALPRVTESGLVLHTYSGHDSLRRSPYGMLEPDPEICPRVPADQIDLAIVPGLAFDPESGIRLGRGGGYYDRLLADENFSAVTIGVGFEFQVQTGLAAEAHDQAVGHVLSETGLRPTRAASARTPGSG